MTIQEIILGDSDLEADWIKHVNGGEGQMADLAAHEAVAKKLRKTPVKKAQVIIGESGSEVPNYRGADGPQRCDNCVYFTFPWCELYEFQAEADDTCDGWQGNPTIKADYAGLIDTIQVIRGGPGSGNWGHKGRKGKIGGSGKGGGTATRVGQARKRVKAAKSAFIAETNKWRDIEQRRTLLASKAGGLGLQRRKDEDKFRTEQLFVTEALRKKTFESQTTGQVSPETQREFEVAVMRRDKAIEQAKTSIEAEKAAWDAHDKFATDHGYPRDEFGTIDRSHGVNQIKKATDDFHQATVADRSILMNDAKKEAAAVRKQLPEMEARLQSDVAFLSEMENDLYTKKGRIITELEPLQGFDTPEKRQLINDLKQTDKEIRGVQSQINTITQNGIEQQRQLVKVDNPANPQYSNNTTNTLPFEKNGWHEGQEGFNDLVGTGTIDGVTFGVQKIGKGGVDRAGYGDGDLQVSGEIFMSTGGSPTTMVHELGHGLEQHDPFVGEQARSFLKQRTGSESPKPLNGLTGRDSYRKDEIAIEDDFSNPYMGKIYKDGSTEIVSMGLESMFFNPARFAERDPEYFDFIYSVGRSG